MDNQRATFLSCTEALTAVGQDFSQYPPQQSLYLKLVSMVATERVMVSLDSRHSGVWLQERGRRRRRLLSPRQLGAYLLERLSAHPISAERLAMICSLVFEVRATAGCCGGETGIWLETEMDRFVCRQCGLCCRSLNYHDGLTRNDIERWQSMGRSDLLAWVRTYRRQDRITGYRIWVPPGTDCVAGTCPWLNAEAGQGRWTCRIHELKPEICRQYPGSRKHARLTGCPAFG